MTIKLQQYCFCSCRKPYVTVQTSLEDVGKAAERKEPKQKLGDHSSTAVCSLVEKRKYLD